MNTKMQETSGRGALGRARKPLILLAVLASVGAVFYLKAEHGTAATSETGTAEETVQQLLPKLIDLGADKCIPCKAMAPILAELKTSLQGQVDVEFIDVWKNPDAGGKYGVQIIPTQIFFDAGGQERFRHEGFFARENILAKWKELGVELTLAAAAPPDFSRWEPAQPDARPKETICYLCDGTIEPRTRTTLKTPAGEVAFCSPHCYVITYASLTDAAKSHEDATVCDWSTGEYTPVLSATYLYGMDQTGRPTIRAFGSAAAAESERLAAGGNVLDWTALEGKELAARCGFCDRPVYPEDASVVRVQGMQTWGCCTMCALGVAARTGQDIEIETRDAHTGEALRVTTLEGHVAELSPAGMVAWAGSRKDAEGKVVSTGCFKQAFFASESNLRAWVEAHPLATGRQVAIEQALSEKMKLTPQQISKACKIGECTPK